jgi:hypothetical protein
MSALGGLNKTPNGVVLGLVQPQPLVACVGKVRQRSKL